MPDKTSQNPPRYGAWSAFCGFSDLIAARVSDPALLVGRLAMGIIFFQSGWAKLGSLSAFSASLTNRGVPFSQFWGPVGAISEFVGGAAIILGLGTRWAAILIVLFVIAASGISHRYWEFVEPAARRLQEGQFYKNLAILGGAIFLFVCGAGRYSLDALFARRN
jgi:putative oxidoreductase